MPNFPFQRLQADLAKLIASTPPGSRLMSEPELAKQLGVSRATLREAMRTFETQGLIRRRQGSGTYVVGKFDVMEAGLEVLESIETMAQRLNLEVSVSDLHVELANADKKTADELRSIVCEAADQRLFTVILTPNYNRAHANHFHLEVTPDVTWHLVR